MDVVTARTGTPELAPWLERWFPPWHDALDAGLAAGRPHPTLWTAAERLVVLRRDETSRASVVLVAVDQDEVVGAARVDLPLLDNLTLAEVLVAVPPAHRRRGVGTALMARLRRTAAAEGRTSLLAVTERPAWLDAWPGELFAADQGLTLRQRNLRRDLALPVPGERTAALLAEAALASRDYCVRTWEGPTPDPARHAVLAGRMTTDAPMGELEYEPESWDADRVLANEARIAAQGRRWWTSVAVDDAGTWVGLSEMGWASEQPDALYQWDTIVLREHRGHRLGMALKLATLAAATSAVPVARRVHTWNAESNAPMIALNEALGFEVTEVLGEWQGPA